MLHALIMAGGGGTRFWPRSRQRRPKQFLNLAGERTLLQQAADRLAGLVPPERLWVITGEAYRAETARQLPGVPPDHVIGEPFGRDTAGCVAVGSALIGRRDPDAVIVVMSADHVIEPDAEFRRAVQVAAEAANQRRRALVTFGIPPAFPATGYGYIQRGEPIGEPESIPLYRVRRFHEKPTAEVAERFMAAGDCFWNSGIFVWHREAITACLSQFEPAIQKAAERVADAWPERDRDAVLRREYEGMKRISIDFAVMEKAPEVLVVRAPYRWDDVGSWLALERHHPQDAHGNTILGEHLGLDTSRCVIAGEPGRLIATAGVDRLLIVQDGDVTLVADARNEALVKKLVELARERGLERYL